MIDRYDLVVLDLDGVVYLGSQAIPGAAAAVQSLVDSGRAVRFVTNNASRRGAEVAQLLRSLRVPAEAAEVFTAARATAELLAGQLPPAARVLVVGAPALAEEIREVGLTPVDTATAAPVAVVQGYGPQVGWAQLSEATLAVRAGARWFATNTDATMPSPRGDLPGNGSLVAAVATALGRGPDVVVGKPEPTLFGLVARDAGRVLVAGDRLDTDVRGAARAGLDSALVLTGVSRPRDLLRAADRPTYVAADLAGLVGDPDPSIPPWTNGAARAGDWSATVDGDELVLAGAGTPVAALRALTGAAWANPGWTAITPAGEPAHHALADLGLMPVS